MVPTFLRCIFSLLILAVTAVPTPAFIDSPLDWIFAPHHMRGLVCPALRYGCCPDLNTWRQGLPCEFPRVITNPKDCYARKEWACCQTESETFTCTTGFVKDETEGVYGWRSGTSREYFGIGKGALTVEEKLAMGRSS